MLSSSSKPTLSKNATLDDIFRQEDEWKLGLRKIVANMEIVVTSMMHRTYGFVPILEYNAFVTDWVTFKNLATSDDVMGDDPALLCLPSKLREFISKYQLP
jgi:hypothetical protein